MTDTYPDTITLDQAVRLLSDVVICDEKAAAANDRVEQAKRGVTKRETELDAARAAVVDAAEAARAAIDRRDQAAAAAQDIPDDLMAAAAEKVSHGRLIRQASIDALAAAKQAARSGDATTSDELLGQLERLGVVNAKAGTANVTTAAGTPNVTTDADTIQED